MRRKYQKGGGWGNPMTNPMTNPRGNRPMNWPKPHPIYDGFRHTRPKPAPPKAIQNLNRIHHILQQQRQRGQALKYLRMMGGLSRLGYPGLMAAAGVGVLMNTTPPLTPQQGMIGPDHYMGVGTPKYRRGGTSCRTPYRLKRRR